MTAQSDQADEIRHALTDPRALCADLGLLEGYRPARQARGLIVRCPRHGDRTPSCSVTLGPDGTIRVRCFGCDLAGDVFSLVAEVRGLDLRRDFPAVKREAADLAGVDLGIGRSSTWSYATPRPAPAPPPPPSYPPANEVFALWHACKHVSDDSETIAYLEARRIDVDMVDLYDLARVLPRDAKVPSWARCGRPWPEAGYQIVLPVYDPAGALCSLRAWRLVPGDGPKRAAPAGYSIAGLVLADGVGRSMLETGRAPSWLRGAPLDVIIAEGEPDFLTWAGRQSDANEKPAAVLGIVAGSWSPEVAARIPGGSRVVIRTHQDAAGYRYAAAIQETLAGRVDLFDFDRSSAGDGSR